MESETTHGGHGEKTGKRPETELNATLDHSCNISEVGSATEREGTRRAPNTGWLPTGDGTRTYRTERTLLETRVTALERAVEQKDKQLQAVIDQYERILEERERQRASDKERDIGGVDIPLENDCSTFENDRSRLRAAVGRIRTLIRQLF